MYGLMRTAACAMPAGQRQAWVGHYCGLCLGLHNRFGLPSRLATNYDSALLIALYEAQSEDPIPKRKSHCVLRRPFTAEVDEPSQPASCYAAGISLLIAANKIRDNLIDDPAWLRGLRTAARALAERWRQAAGGSLAEVGFDALLIERQFSRQAAVEALEGRDFTFYSQPTELAVGAAFAHTAVLQRKMQDYEPLFEIGRRFGRIMLLLDAYRDYHDDARLRHFNALAASYRGEGWRQSAQSLFLQIHSQLREALGSLDLPKPALLDNLLIHQLGKIGRHSLALCDTRGNAALAEPRAAHPLAEAGYPSIYPMGYYPDDQESTVGKDPFPEDNRPCSCGNCCNRRREPRSSGDLSDICYTCYWIDCNRCDCGLCCVDCDCDACINCGECDCGDCDCGDFVCDCS